MLQFIGFRIGLCGRYCSFGSAVQERRCMEGHFGPDLHALHPTCLSSEGGCILEPRTD